MGKQYVGEFSEGERTGLGIAYDADGSIAQSGKWRNNELIQPMAPGRSEAIAQEIRFIAVTRCCRLVAGLVAGPEH
jgi:hypothetical protein